jgi:hypothetical protein
MELHDFLQDSSFEILMDLADMKLDMSRAYSPSTNRLCITGKGC